LSIDFSHRARPSAHRFPARRCHRDDRSPQLALWHVQFLGGGFAGALLFLAFAFRFHRGGHCGLPGGFCSASGCCCLAGLTALLGYRLVRLNRKDSFVDDGALIVVDVAATELVPINPSLIEPEPSA
jgi:hypothetical protein